MSSLTKHRLIQYSSRFYNIELGIVGALSALLVILINWWGTGYVAWHAASIRFVLNIVYHLFITKAVEYLVCPVSTWWGRQIAGNILPNTLFGAIQVAIFSMIGIPRPLLSVWPFWLFSLLTFTQIVKHAHRGYEAGFLDIVHGFCADARTAWNRVRN